MVATKLLLVQGQGTIGSHFLKFHISKNAIFHDFHHQTGNGGRKAEFEGENFAGIEKELWKW